MLTDAKRNPNRLCGAVTPHMERNVDAFKILDRLNMINFGEEVALKRMRELYEPEIDVAGNIDHIQLLPLKTPEQVKASCLNAIAEAGGHESRHFIWHQVAR
ncbi:MAG: hypothetical protein O6928_10875 [Gammaproteobacteria bacterium]|nr:hypothetical protein [Gammaproteobacteria bacterium]